MKLPNIERAIISKKKLSGYLLSESHPIGKSKAKFFNSLGFNEKNIDDLVNAFRSIAREGEVVEEISSPYGVKYVVEGVLNTKAGRGVRMRTVWIIEKDSDEPRFVTAYPAPAL